MSDKYIAQLEDKIERLVEGAFTGLFRKRLSAHDIAVKLVRSVEDNLHQSNDNPTRLFAPDEYVIHVHPDVHQRLLRHHPTISQTLSENIVELAAQADYRLASVPTVRLIANSQISASTVEVRARHHDPEHESTAAMTPVPASSSQDKPANPQLVIKGKRSIPLETTIINIGRGDDNDIVLDDKYVSRHHVQIRLRFGIYTLFDIDSRSGTYVNNIMVSEHRLQSGDVIRLGQTQLIYMTDDAKSSNDIRTTQTLDAVDEDDHA